jgi:hypothetical protein
VLPLKRHRHPLKSTKAQQTRSRTLPPRPQKTTSYYDVAKTDPFFSGSALPLI